MSSFDSIDYSVRPNKSVERKLIFEALKILNAKIDLSQYRYIGLGGRSFIDFLLAHRYLLVKDMISISYETEAARADFNKPYGSIVVSPGESSDVLPQIGLGDRLNMLWLDYDKSIGAPVLVDVEIVANSVCAGSLFLVTLNAHNKNIPSKDQDGNAMDPERALRHHFGDLIPTALPAGALTGNGYPKFLANIIIQHIKQCVFNSGRGLKFFPIFNYRYRDGAPMITVGGIIGDQYHEILLNESGIDSVDSVTGEEQFEINVPNLTVKEKLALDCMLLREAPPSVTDVLGYLGFELDNDELAAYHRFYRLYPVFGEYQL